MSKIWNALYPNLALFGIVAVVIGVVIASEYALYVLAQWPYLVLALVALYVLLVAAGTFKRP